ncbi:MAG TPA: SpoIID/LytB domain-containing protein [Gaiellaceae bacterium]|nr:SpoIID/LytB domain-containing protein [Gaiellaceae bacterium]
MGRYATGLAAACLLILGALASTLLAATPVPPPSTTSSAATSTSLMTTSPASSVVVVNGHGWGHGLGMSQWGAYGYAKHGWTFDRILAHYYSGTTLGSTKVSTVRVLLASAKKTTIESTATWSVVDANGTKVALDPGVLVLTAALALADHPELQPPFIFVGKQPLIVDKVPYRGKFSVSSDGKLLQVIDTVGLESYLKGVVPAEMPSSWSPEALKAQAVAARSYALANLTTGRPFDLYGDTRSQVFGGVKVENAATSAAVDATKGQVVLYKGKVANTLFFSTSGGRTASAFESTGLNVPYLVPVADPYDTASPYHDWGPVLFDATVVAKQFKLAAPIADLLTTTGPSGRVKSLTVVSDDESQVTMNGNQVRGALDLRSTWFTPALLQLLPKSKTMTYGGALTLTGRARGVDTVSLEARAYGLDWAPAGELLVDANGVFSTIVHPQIATQYRLAWGNVRAGLAKIAVAARVDATVQRGAATGTTKPVAAYAPTELQWSANGLTAWQTVASSTTDGSGAFSLSAPSPETTGAYRVRVTPGHGLAPGLSKTACC